MLAAAGVDLGDARPELAGVATRLRRRGGADDPASIEDVLRAADFIRHALYHDLAAVGRRFGGDAQPPGAYAPNGSSLMHTVQVPRPTPPTPTEVRPAEVLSPREQSRGAPAEPHARAPLDEPPHGRLAESESLTAQHDAISALIAELRALAAPTTEAPPAPPKPQEVGPPAEAPPHVEVGRAEPELDLPPPTGPPVIAAPDPWTFAEPELASEQPLSVPAPLPEPALRPLPRGMLIRPALSAVGVVGVVLCSFLVYALYGTGLLEGHAQHTLRRAFRSEVATAERQPGLPAPRVLADLSIPSIGVDDIVAEGVSPSVLSRGPGFVPPLIESPQPPPVVIVGHRTTYGAAFRHIADLKVGGQVIVRTPQGVVATYSVERKARFGVRPHLKSPDGRQRLYLVSADPPYSDSGRVVVVADRTDAGATLMAPSPPPIPVPSLGGTGGDAVVALFALGAVFLLAFARSLYASVWSRLRRRVAGILLLVAAVASWQLLLGSRSPVI